MYKIPMSLFRRFTLLLSLIPLFSAFSQGFHAPPSQVGEAVYTLRGGPELQYRSETEYDEQGREIRRLYRDPDGGEANQTESFYDGEGRLTKRIYRYPLESLPDRENFFYDHEGRLSREEMYITRGTYGWIYRNYYDGEGRLVRRDKYDRYWKDRVVYQLRYLYGDDPLRRETEAYGMAGQLLLRRLKEYDEAGRLKREELRDAQGGFIWAREYRYDPAGRLLEETAYSVEDEIFYRKVHRYEDNEKGDWIRRWTGTLDEEWGLFFIPETMIERSIEYQGEQDGR